MIPVSAKNFYVFCPKKSGPPDCGETNIGDADKRDPLTYDDCLETPMKISKTQRSLGMYELATGVLKKNIMGHERRNKMG
jgi:hypothetical protein